MHPLHGRRVALVDDQLLRMLTSHRSIYEFAFAAMEAGTPLANLVLSDVGDRSLDYDEVHSMRTEWSFLRRSIIPLSPRAAWCPARA